MKRNKFENLFYRLAEQSPDDLVEEAQGYIDKDKCYLQKLNQKCETYAYRNSVSAKDALQYFFEIGNILPTSYERGKK